MTKKQKEKMMRMKNLQKEIPMTMEMMMMIVRMMKMRTKKKKKVCCSFLLLLVSKHS